MSCFLVCNAAIAQDSTYQIKELNYSVQEDVVMVKMDTIKNQVLVSTCTKDKVNIQFFAKENLAKVKEQNFPLNLEENEKISDLYISDFEKFRVILKTYSPKKISIKYIEINGPGLISKPQTLLELENQHLSLILTEINPKKSADKQVHVTFSANKRFMAIINKQSLVCSIDGKGLEIYNYDYKLELKNTYVEESCAFKNLYLFSNGKIALSKSVQNQVNLAIYSSYFLEKTLDYTFPEITKIKEGEGLKRDTFDQQFQFYFDDNNSLVYAYIKGFVNNNYISHTGLYIYDVQNNRAVLSSNNVHKTKAFLKYSISLRDNLAAYEFEYPMHLNLRYIKKNEDGSYEVIGDYISYGSLPLAEQFAGVAKSEATYLMHLTDSGKLIDTKILLHRQSIITYPSDIADKVGYYATPQGIDYRIGQVYLYDNDYNYVLHNNDKRAFYSTDRLYKFTYFGKDGVVAGTKFSNDLKTKEKVDGLKGYALLPMQASINLSPEKVLVFGSQKKEIKLLAISLLK